MERPNARPMPILTQFQMVEALTEAQRLLELSVAEATGMSEALTAIEHPTAVDGYRAPDPMFAMACLELVPEERPDSHLVLGRPPLYSEDLGVWQYYDVRTQSYAESVMTPQEFYGETLDFLREAYVNSYDCAQFYGMGGNIERRHPADIAYFRHLLLDRSVVTNGAEEARPATPRNN